jgi:adenine-specific DNA methylase
MDKKIIEFWFPIKEVGLEGQKEKQVAVGRPPSIHNYFARRPTAAARAIILASILKIPEDDKDLSMIFKLIIDYGKRDAPNYVNVNGKKFKTEIIIQELLDKQKININKMKGFDLFSGGGTFPLEMRYLGLNSYSSDLNPVAILIEMATCNYPQNIKKSLIQEIESIFNRAQKYLEKNLKEYFSNSIKNGNQVKFYLWAFEVDCSECKLKIPLIKNSRLSKKYNWSLEPNIPNSDISNLIEFKISPVKNAVKYYTNGKIICPRCQKTLNNEYIMEWISKYPHSHRLLAIYEDLGKKSDKKNARGQFRIPNKNDFIKAQVDRNEIEEKLLNKYPSLNLKFPDKALHWSIQNFGIKSIFKCFTSRQLLVLKTLLDFIEIIKEEKKNFLNEEINRAIFIYLSFGIVKMADFNSVFTFLKSMTSPRLANSFSRSGLRMSGTFVEVNPINKSTSGSWMKYFDSLKRALINLIKHPIIDGSSIFINQMDAMELEYENNSMDFCFTDPPYYDNINYAQSMDFFYTWHKAALSDIFPDIFLFDSTPKENELIQEKFRHGGNKNAKSFYEKGMGKAFYEIFRVLKPEGLAVIIFAHKDTNAWETLLQAIIDSKLVITASWPLLMESASPLRSKNIASLDSVVILICRKQERKPMIYFDEKFRNFTEQSIVDKLESQWRLGFKGADFFLSAMGPALEVLSSYEAILDIKTDTFIELNEYLRFIDQILVNFSLKKALNQDTIQIDGETQLYLIWKLNYGIQKLKYDELWKFLKSLGLEEKNLIGKIIIRTKINSKIVYSCMEIDDKINDFKKDKYNPNTIIEKILFLAYLWGNESPKLSERVEIYLKSDGEKIWEVAQSICNMIPDSNENRLISGLLKKYSIQEVNSNNKEQRLKNSQKKFFVKNGKIEWKL